MKVIEFKSKAEGRTAIVTELLKQVEVRAENDQVTSMAVIMFGTSGAATMYNVEDAIRMLGAIEVLRSEILALVRLAPINP